MNEAGYDLVAHKHYREHVINIMRVRSERFVKRDRKLSVHSGATCSIPCSFFILSRSMNILRF